MTGRRNSEEVLAGAPEDADDEFYGLLVEPTYKDYYDLFDKYVELERRHEKTCSLLAANVRVMKEEIRREMEEAKAAAQAEA